MIGDITKPARDKLLWKVGDLVYGSDELERMLLGQIQKRFDLGPIPADVLQVDRLIVGDEMLKLFHAPNIPRRRRRLGIEIVPLSPKRAEILFLQRAWQLGLDEMFSRSNARTASVSK